jgi:hypothetical protein
MFRKMLVVEPAVRQNGAGGKGATPTSPHLLA